MVVVIGDCCFVSGELMSDPSTLAWALRQTVVMPGRLHSPCYHSSPSIRQFKPLPIPRNPTRFPRVRNSLSEAIAAVIGKDTEPMFPRWRKVVKSLWAGISSVSKMLFWWASPTWWQIILSGCPASRCNPCLKTANVSAPSRTPFCSTSREWVSIKWRPLEDFWVSAPHLQSS